VTVPSGATVEVAFGLRFQPPTATPTHPPLATRPPRPVPTPTPTPDTTSGVRDISGLIVAAIAVALFVAMRALRGRG